ncbi:NADH-quinone oxidoreductase subunit G [compost metagenome]
MIGIGSPRASLESNFALRELVGAGNFYSGIAASELENLRLIRQLLDNGPLPTPSLRELEEFDAVFVLGEDLTQTAPRIALALRQATKGKATEIAAAAKIPEWHQLAVQNVAQHALHPLFIASVTATRLDDVAEECVHAAPDDLARLGCAVAHAIDPSAPAVAGLDAEAAALAARIAAALLAGQRPLIVAGASLGSQALIEAAGNIAKALKNREKNAGISLVVAEANSLGLALLGGESMDAALDALISGQADAVLVLENDLYRRAAADKVDAALAKAKVLIVADHQHTATSARADLVLPAASFAEGDGTLVSQEGRAQRFFQVFEPSYYDAEILVREGWRWLHALHSTLQGQQVDWTQLDQVTAACAAAQPELAGIVDAAPTAAFRIKGLKLAREPLRYSGRTSMRANLSVHEPRQPQDPDSAFAFSMEGYSGSVEDRQQIPFAWSPGWNSPQAWNKFQDEVGGHLRAGDPGVRLFDAPSDRLDWFAVPAAQVSAAGRWQVVALHHLFGSDETSSRAAPVQERIQAAYAALGSDAAARLNLKDGAQVSLKVAGRELRLPLKVIDELADGLLGLPAGFDGIPPLAGKLFAEALQEVAQ